jgi:hypothetical protein
MWLDGYMNFGALRLWHDDPKTSLANHWVDRELVLDLEKRVTELERRAVRRAK